MATPLLSDRSRLLDKSVFYVDVLRDGDTWVPILYILDKNGTERSRIRLPPLQSSTGSPGFLSDGTLAVGAVPSSGLAVVGLASSVRNSSKYRLDLVDARSLKYLRSIALEESPESHGTVAIATSSTGQVAVWAGTANKNSVFVSSADDLNSFRNVGETRGCVPVSSSSALASAPYFLCSQPASYGSGSIWTIGSQGLHRYPLLGTFYSALSGTADSGEKILVGAAISGSLLEFDLSTGRIVATYKENKAASSFLDPFKQIFHPPNASAYAVVPSPVAVTNDRVFFSDGSKVFCLTLDGLNLVGEAQVQSATAVVAGPQDQAFVALDSNVELLNPDCSTSRSYPYGGQEGDPAQRLFYLQG